MKQLIINLFIISTLAGCQNTSCPSFPEIIKVYMPYFKGEAINFVSSNNDTLHMVILDQWVTQPYTFKWNCKCSCEASMGFKTSLETDQLLKIEGEIIIYPEEKKSDLIIEFFNSQGNSDSFTIAVENIDPYLVNSTNLFGDTIKIEKEDSFRIENIKIIYGKGLIEFYDKIQNCSWVKIN